MSLDAAAWRRLDAAVRAASVLPLAERDTALQNALGDTPELLRAAREALDPDGNDYPVKALGVPCRAVEGWQDTAAFLETLLAD